MITCYIGKKSRRRKPLLLQGARQVGKTWLVREFGQNEYKNYIYLNFEQQPGLNSLFSGELSPSNIIQNISLLFGYKIEDKDTLIFFDEVQVVPQAITSLKYFYEQAPEYHIIAAGSLLGVQIGKPDSFPVGKVNFMTLYPMSFEEFLLAIGEKLIVDQLFSKIPEDPIPEILHNKLIQHLKLYLYLGGMPEIIEDYIQHNDIAEVRTIQLEILEAYKKDFSKYTEAGQVIKTSEVWQSIPYQLAKENKKFKYSDVRKKTRASTFEQTLEWLKNAGLIHLAYNISTPKLPLAGYADYSKFKVYLLDTGLLGAMLGLSSEMIINPTAIFSEYNGAFIENFIGLELIKAGYSDLFYWTSRSDAEVDFLVQHQNLIYPLEVKSGKSRNLKSLRSYSEKYGPDQLLRVSPRNFVKDQAFRNLPLYAVFLLPKML